MTIITIILASQNLLESLIWAVNVATLEKDAVVIS